MPFSTFYLPSSFCSHFLLSSILLFFSFPTLTLNIKITLSPDKNLTLMPWLANNSSQAFVSFFSSSFQFLLIFLHLLFPSTFSLPSLFSSFSFLISTPLPFSLPSFLFLLFFYLLFFYLLSSHPPFLLEESPNNFNFPDLCFTSFSIGRLASFVVKSALSVSPFLLNVASWKLLKQGMFCCHKV